MLTQDVSGVKLVISNKKYGDFKGFGINFEGFSEIPFPFYKKGFTAGRQILEQFYSKFDDFSLTITKNGKSEFIRQGKSTKIYLNFDDYMDMRHRCFILRRKADKNTIIRTLPKYFPGSFKPLEISVDEISVPPEIAKLNFSKNELKRFRNLAPKLVEYGIFSEKDLKKLIEARPVLHYMHLEKLLKQFQQRLKQDLSESKWQIFFKENLIALNPGYVFCIEKENIDLGVKLPDFILIDVSGYVDIYEIKTPETPLLRYDRNRDNYFWTSDICAAISQVENYIDALTRNKDSLRNIIKDRSNFDPRIVRPRGYVIAGMSSQCENVPKKRDDFRLLNESLRDAQIIPYDLFLKKFSGFSKATKIAYQAGKSRPR